MKLFKFAVFLTLAANLASCDEPSSNASSGNTGGQSSTVAVQQDGYGKDGPLLVGDTLTHSAEAITDRYKRGDVFCYDLNISDNSCRGIEYADIVSPTKTVIKSFYLHKDGEKHVIISDIYKKGKYLCTTLDESSVTKSFVYFTSDRVAKIDDSDISLGGDRLDAWRDDLRRRWTGQMDIERCYQYVSHLKNGKAAPGELQEVKFIGGIKQPSEKPTMLVSFRRQDLPKLWLRPLN